jgi:DNA-binding response OmpR family regulator
MKKILVLHSDETIRTTIGTMLEQEEFALTWALDTGQALNEIRGLKPQLLLIDLPLAGMSAVEVCLQLRASIYKRRLSSLATTGTR